MTSNDPMRCTECNKEMKNGWDETKQPGDLIRYGYALKCSECVWARRRLNNVEKLRQLRAIGCKCPSCGLDYSRELSGPLLKQFQKVSNHQPKCQWEEPVVFFFECRRCARIRGKGRCFRWTSPTAHEVLDCTPKTRTQNYQYEDGFTRTDFRKDSPGPTGDTPGRAQSQA